MCNIQYQPAKWNRIASLKHHRRGLRVEKMWDRSILAVLTANGDSLYDPHLTPQEIEKFEMECVTAVDKRDGELETGLPHVRRFYRKFDCNIGASEGRKTPYILVQYNNDGSVHGYPVTKEYLKSKGALII